MADEGEQGSGGDQGAASGRRSEDGQRSEGDAVPTVPMRRGLLAGLVAVGVVAIALAVGVGVWYGEETIEHSPQTAAMPYLHALVTGDVAAAVRAGHITTHSPLVSRAVYGRTPDRVSSFAITEATVDGTHAQVEVDYVQGGRRHAESLSLKATGRDLMFFTRWALQPVELDRVDITTVGPADASLTVNGAVVHTSGGILQALPGAYHVSFAPDDDYTSAARAFAASDLDRPGDAVDPMVEVDARLTSAGEKAARAAVDAWVDDCVASTALRPAGCSFYAIDDLQQFTQTDPRWKLDSAPTFTVGDWDGDGWTVKTVTPGSATFTAHVSDSAGDSGTAYTDPIPVQVEGSITGFEDGKAVFRSIDWGNAQSGTSV